MISFTQHPFHVVFYFSAFGTLVQSYLAHDSGLTITSFVFLTGLCTPQALKHSSHRAEALRTYLLMTEKYSFIDNQYEHQNYGWRNQTAGTCVHNTRKLWEGGQPVLSSETKAEASLTTPSSHSPFSPVAIFFSFPPSSPPTPFNVSLSRDAA